MTKNTFTVLLISFLLFLTILKAKGFNKKSPRGIRPRRCCPSPRGAKYEPQGQDEYLFDRAKTGGLGQVTPPPQKEKPQGH